MIVISQPTYMPWIGYFSLIYQSSKFVFLDNVRFDRSSWQQRNRILNNENIQYLTIPVVKKGKYDQLIKDVKIKNNNFAKEHITSIHHSYRKSKYFEKYFPKIEDIFNKIQSKTLLSEINIFLIKEICKIVDIEGNFFRSSEIKVDGKKTSLLLNLCNHLDESVYLSNEGAEEYLNKDIENFKQNRKKIVIQKFKLIKYKQLSTKFNEKLSIIDLLFNEGPKTRSIISQSFLNKNL